MDANKEKALEAALGQIDRQFGKGTVMRMGDTERVAIPAISTGSLGLDIALGIGGLPRGRIVEIYGPESSGKTTLTLQVIAEAQKALQEAIQRQSEHQAGGVQEQDREDRQPNQTGSGGQPNEVAYRCNRVGQKQGWTPGRARARQGTLEEGVQGLAGIN